MITKSRSTAATVLGILSLIGPVLVWTFIFAPLRWNIRFPGGVWGAILTLLLAIAMSVIAGICGKRAWFVATVFSVFTFVYWGFLLKSPWWQ